MSAALVIDFPVAGQSRHAAEGGHEGVARDGDQPAGTAAIGGAPPIAAIHSAPRSLFDPTLSTIASLLDDIEGLRKAQSNRLRILTATEPDEDGITRGFGLDETHPGVQTTQALIDQLEAVEHQTILALQRAVRQHPLAAWQKQARGVGEKQFARLLAATGDPYMRTTETGSEPRTVDQLWAYCGLHLHGDEAARRRKGQVSNWSTDAKTRAYLISTSIIKAGGPYREVYDKRRARTAESHPDWTDGHSHNDALRIVSKRVLRDLWRAARDWHNSEQR